MRHHTSPMVDVWIMATNPVRRGLLSHSASSDPSIRVAGTAPPLAVLRSLIEETSGDVAVVDLQSEMEPAGVREWLFELLDLVPILILASEYDPEVFHRI